MAIAIVAAAATRKEIWEPYKTRAKRSRPYSSVPNGWLRDGAWSLLGTSITVGP